MCKELEPAVNIMNKNVLIFALITLGLTLSKCGEDDLPNYPVEPYIEFRTIEFIETPAVTDVDTINLTIYFRDGDDDLGLNPSHLDDPYHLRNYYFENADNQSVTPVGTVMQQVNSTGLPSQIPMIVSNPSGKLVTKRTKHKPGFDFLPQFSSSSMECKDYTIGYLLIGPTAKNTIDASYAIVDTLFDSSSQPYYLLKDTLYFQYNLNYNNIFIRFHTSNDGVSYSEFSWEDQFCQTYNGRLPILTTDSNKIKFGLFQIVKKNKFEGEIKYSLISTGFKPLFGGKKLKLTVQIKDRALNESNLVETNILEF